MVGDDFKYGVDRRINNAMAYKEQNYGPEKTTQ
jgi:hypothetical protein